jgi:hypothetical protein
MSSFLLPFVVISITTLIVGPVSAQPTNSPWFPTLEGSAWHYRLGEKKLTIRVTAHEKQGTLQCARLETSEKGSALAVQHVAETPAGIVRVMHNGEKVTPQLVFLKLPTAKDQSWEVDSKIESPSGPVIIKGNFTADEDDVKVPAGEFRKVLRVKAELKINDKPVTITSWYAERFGMVRQVVKIDGQDYLLELEKFEDGK